MWVAQLAILTVEATQKINQASMIMLIVTLHQREMLVIDRISG